MNEKKSIKLSLSTLFLIIAIMIIVVMGYFMYQLHIEKTIMEEQITELSLKVNELKSTTILKQENNKYSHKDIKGVYEFNKQVPEDEEEVNCELFLYEDGTFKYIYTCFFERSILGNYFIDHDEIILNKLFEAGSDVEIKTIDGEIKLKINKDGSITDINSEFANLIEENIELNKLSEKEEKERLKYGSSILDRINLSIKNNAIFNEEN